MHGIVTTTTFTNPKRVPSFVHTLVLVLYFNTSVCIDPATTKAKTLAFVLLRKQSINQSPPATAGHNSLRRNYFRVILYLFIQSNPSYHTRRRYSTDMITTRADRTNKSHHGVSMVWIHGYIRVHDNTTTLAFVSLLVQTIKQSNQSNQITPPTQAWWSFFSKTKLLPGDLIPVPPTQATRRYSLTASQPHSLTANSQQPTERTSHYHTWYIRVHDNTRQHDTHFSNSRYQYRLVTHSIPLSLQSCSVIVTSGCFRSALNRSFPGERGRIPIVGLPPAVPRSIPVRGAGPL
jgi:hypothetical protein